MKKSVATFLLFVVVQWAVLRLFPGYISFLTAILFGVAWATEKNLFGQGMLIGMLAWFIPFTHYFTGTGMKAAQLTAQIFELSGKSGWLLFVMTLLFGGFLTAVGMQIGKYLRLSFQEK